MNAAISQYTIRTQYLLVREADDSAERLRFHVETGDCFAMLATALGLLEDSLKEGIQLGTQPQVRDVMFVRKLRADLMTLQRDYYITPKHLD